MPDRAPLDIISRFNNFTDHFDLSLAATPEEKRAVYTVRYNVYCDQLGFEEARDPSGGLETDAYDQHSIHCLVTHRRSGIPAGCVRLVTVDADTWMPLERLCSQGMSPGALRRTRDHRGRLVEVSRLAVDVPFCGGHSSRSRGVDQDITIEFSPKEREAFPWIALSLFLATGAVADLLRRTECYALMEPFLQRMLRRAGVNAERVGEDVEFRGTRAPYHLNVDEAIRSLPHEMRLCFDMVRAAIASELNPQVTRADAVSESWCHDEIVELHDSSLVLS